MPITETTYRRTNDYGDTEVSVVETLYVGRVVRVVEVVRNRNHSDTLDYSDWRSTKCTEALVYVGRVWKGRWGFETEKPCPVQNRFQTEDCTNLFTWRGAPSRTAVADEESTWTDEMREDYRAWQEWHAVAADAAMEAAERRQAEAQLQEMDRLQKEPRKGRQLRVVKGRKVPVGTEGVCIWIGEGGYGSRVGIKDATGVVHWTAASNTVAIDALPVAAPIQRDLGGYTRRGYQARRASGRV
jgi:hypothetical protein